MAKDIPYFRGVFMRDNLPVTPSLPIEYGIINLDSSNNRGTHWTAYKKIGRLVNYFDPIGNLPPPSELQDYFGNKVTIYYNTKRYQNLNATDCGYKCIDFLHN